METNWMDKIKQGMKLIIEGCKENTSWCNCKLCPFDDFCISIDKDDSHRFTTPNGWIKEGLDLTVKGDKK